MLIYKIKFEWFWRGPSTMILPSTNGLPPAGACLPRADIFICSLISSSVSLISAVLTTHSCLGTSVSTLSFSGGWKQMIA